MADVNDTNGSRRQLKRVIDKIEDADVTDADREAIRAYAKWRRRRSDSINTASTYIRDVTLSAERHDKPLTAVDGTVEVDRIIDAHENAGCKSANGINTKLASLREFWRWCDTTDYGLDDYRWVDLVKDVTASDENPGAKPVSPEFVLGEQEIITMREAADNLRDKALIEYLADTGARITLATQMKRGDVNLDATPPTFRPNPEGIGHKDVPTKDYVLHESARHLRTYLNETHPDEHPDAPLFALRQNYDADDRQNGAISRKYASQCLKRAAESAGIDRERAHAHNFRRAAVVRMRLKHDMSWDAIQKRTAWSDLSLSHMKQVYRRIDNSDEIEMVARELGYAETDESGEPTETECWNCGQTVTVGDTFCRACGVESDANPEATELSRALGRFATENPDKARDIIDALESIQA